MAIRKKLGEILIEQGATAQEGIKRALGHQRQWGGKIGRILVGNSSITEEQLAKALAAQSRMPMAKMKSDIPAAILGLLPPDLAEKHQAVAFGLRTVEKVETVYVAIADPYDVPGMDAIRFRVGKAVKFALAPADEILKAIRLRVHGPEESLDFDGADLGDEKRAPDPAPAPGPPRLAPAPAPSAMDDLFGSVPAAPSADALKASSELDSLMGIEPESKQASAASALDDLFESPRPAPVAKPRPAPVAPSAVVKPSVPVLAPTAPPARPAPAPSPEPVKVTKFAGRPAPAKPVVSEAPAAMSWADSFGAAEPAQVAVAPAAEPEPEFDLSSPAEALAAFEGGSGGFGLDLPDAAPLELESGADALMGLSKGIVPGEVAAVEAPLAQPSAEPEPAPEERLEQVSLMDLGDAEVLPGIELSADEIAPDAPTLDLSDAEMEAEPEPQAIPGPSASLFGPPGVPEGAPTIDLSSPEFATPAPMPAEPEAGAAGEDLASLFAAPAPAQPVAMPGPAPLMPSVPFFDNQPADAANCASSASPFGEAPADLSLSESQQAAELAPLSALFEDSGVGVEAAALAASENGGPAPEAEALSLDFEPEPAAQGEVPEPVAAMVASAPTPSPEPLPAGNWESVPDESPTASSVVVELDQRELTARVEVPDLTRARAAAQPSPAAAAAGADALLADFMAGPIVTEAPGPAAAPPETGDWDAIPIDAVVVAVPEAAPAGVAQELAAQPEEEVELDVEETPVSAAEPVPAPAAAEATSDSLLGGSWQELAIEKPEGSEVEAFEVPADLASAQPGAEEFAVDQSWFDEGQPPDETPAPPAAAKAAPEPAPEPVPAPNPPDAWGGFFDSSRPKPTTADATAGTPKPTDPPIDDLPFDVGPAHEDSSVQDPPSKVLASGELSPQLETPSEEVAPELAIAEIEVAESTPVDVAPELSIGEGTEEPSFEIAPELTPPEPTPAAMELSIADLSEEPVAVDLTSEAVEVAPELSIGEVAAAPASVEVAPELSIAEVAAAPASVEVAPELSIAEVAAAPAPVEVSPEPSIAEVAAASAPVEVSPELSIGEVAEESASVEVSPELSIGEVAGELDSVMVSPELSAATAPAAAEPELSIGEFAVEEPASEISAEPSIDGVAPPALPLEAAEVAVEAAPSSDGAAAGPAEPEAVETLDLAPEPAIAEAPMAEDLSVVPAPEPSSEADAALELGLGDIEARPDESGETSSPGELQPDLGEALSFEEAPAPAEVESDSKQPEEAVLPDAGLELERLFDTPAEVVPAVSPSSSEEIAAPPEAAVDGAFDALVNPEPSAQASTPLSPPDELDSAFDALTPASVVIPTPVVRPPKAARTAVASSGAEAADSAVPAVLSSPSAPTASGPEEVDPDDIIEVESPEALASEAAPPDEPEPKAPAEALAVAAEPAMSGGPEGLGSLFDDGALDSFGDALGGDAGTLPESMAALAPMPPVEAAPVAATESPEAQAGAEGQVSAATNAVYQTLAYMAVGEPLLEGMMEFPADRLGPSMVKVLLSRGAIAPTEVIGMLAIPAEKFSAMLVKTLMEQAWLGADDLVSLLAIPPDRLNATVLKILMERGMVTGEEVLAAFG